MNDKIKILFELGEADRDLDWPDYLHYGFDESDIPALLELLQDTSLHNAETDSNEIWVPLYAWRILGQLKAEQAVAPLIALFDTLVDDDWAFNELPVVMGMIGKTALEPLAIFLQEKHHDEFARANAMDSLTEIAIRHPESKQRVIDQFTKYMAEPDKSATSLNGLLIGRLTDLDAKETIDDIRQLFKKECVDISCAGDLEEVEIIMGFRQKRSTPKPDYYPELKNLPELILEEPDSDDLYEHVNYYLLKYGHDDSILDVSELDGFFAALACLPETIMPSTWFPAIWDGESMMPEWENKKELEKFNQYIFSIYNDVMQTMHDDNYEALFMASEVDGKTNTIVDEWCNGFLRGINLLGPLAAMDAKVIVEQLQPMRLFTTEAGWEQLNKMDMAQVEQEQNKIEPAVRVLFHHFLEQREFAHQPVTRSSPKVGRNDPCSCGSGKKYKKCCGLH
jgi:uncharacterized protein